MRYLLTSVLIVLMMVATASAYSIHSNDTDVGDLDQLLDVYTSYSALDDAGLSDFLIPDAFGSGWTLVDNESDIYAHVLEGSMDSFVVLANDLFYLYDNNGENGTRWAVIDSAFELGDEGQSEGQEQAPVPEPSTMLLLGTGLVGLAWYGRKRKRA